MKYDNGFSMVELSVVLVISALVGMGFMQMTKQSNDVNNKVQDSLDMLVLIENTNRLISQSGTCFSTLDSNGFKYGHEDYLNLKNPVQLSKLTRSVVIGDETKNKTFLDKSKDYGRIQVDSIRLEAGNGFEADSYPDSKYVRINVVYELKSPSRTINRVVKNSFLAYGKIQDQRIYFDGRCGKVDNLLSDSVKNIMENIRKKSCDGYNGQLDENGKCIITLGEVNSSDNNGQASADNSSGINGAASSQPTPQFIPRKTKFIPRCKVDPCVGDPKDPEIFAQKLNRVNRDNVQFLSTQKATIANINKLFIEIDTPSTGAEEVTNSTINAAAQSGSNTTAVGSATTAVGSTNRTATGAAATAAGASAARAATGAAAGAAASRATAR